MTDLMTWIDTHRMELLEMAAAAWVLASIYVRLTPGKADDEALSRLRAALERASFLQPRDGKGILSLPGAPARREAKLLESRR